MKTLAATLTRQLPVAAMAFVLTGFAPVAWADPPTKLNRAERMTGSVTVKAVDVTARKVTLTSADGEDVTFDVPAEYRNLERLNAGDKITAVYARETEIAVSPRNARTPEDAATLVAARAPEGERPAAFVANKVVVTGAVLGVDMANHTIQLVSPEGGEVLTLPVTKADGREAMGRLKVGDRITATITEGLLLEAVTPKAP